jgi:hypothetical protein
MFLSVQQYQLEHSSMPNTKYQFKELDDKYVEPIKHLIQNIVYPLKRYLGYRNTAIIVLKDGRHVPLLHYLAKVKYGDSYDMTQQEAIWSDTNWYNATPDNITLLDRTPHTSKRAGRPSRLNLGVPYGHPDYQRRYLEVTRDKQKEYRRKRYVKKRYEAIEAADQASTAPDDVLPDPQVDSMQGRLQDILLSTKISNTKAIPDPTVPRPDIRWSEIHSSDIPSHFSKEFMDGLAAAETASELNERSVRKHRTSSGAKK